MNKQITIYGYCDSLCESKGHSPMHLGYWAKDQGDNILFAKHEIVRNKQGNRVRATNNQAEYYSLIALHNACWAWAFSNLCPSESEPFEDQTLNNQYGKYTNALRLAKKNDETLNDHMLALQERLDTCDKISSQFGKLLKSKTDLTSEQITEVSLYATRILFESSDVCTPQDLLSLYQALGHDDFEILFYMRKKAYKNKSPLSETQSVIEEVNRHKNFILNDNNLVLHFHTDANLMYSQLCALPGIGNKETPWKVKNPGLISLFNKVAGLKNKLNFTLEWIPREENERANQLAENVVDRDNYKKSSLENFTRQAEVVEVKRSVNDLPESSFVASYFDSSLPQLKEEFIELLQTTEPSWNNISACFNAMQMQIAKLLKVIPSTPDLQQSRRMHAEAGRLAKDTLQLLDKDYRGRFNGPFISLIMNIWRSGQEISPDELAKLANQSISQDSDNPCAWFHNLVRMHSPVNSSLLTNAFNLLMQEMNSFEESISAKDISSLRIHANDFFSRLNIGSLGAVAKKEDNWNSEDISHFGIEIPEEQEAY